MKNRKVVFTAKGQIELQSVDFELPKLGENEVLIRNHYSLISSGTELACLNGLESSWFHMPAVPGYIGVGEVVAKGENVNDLREDEIVYHFGGHSEYLVLPSSNCFSVPAEIEEKYVPFVRIATIALAAIRVSNITFGDYVAVTGQGLVGIMTAQLAHLQGAQAIGIDHHENRLDIAKQCQVDFVVNSAEKDMKQELERLTGGRMVNTFVEAIGNTKLLAEATQCMARNGEIVILGTPRTEYTTNCSDLFMKVFHSGSDIRFKGAHEWRDSFEEDRFARYSISGNTKTVMQYMANGRLLYKPLLTHVVRPEECAAIYTDLQADKNAYMGVVFDWT